MNAGSAATRQPVWHLTVDAEKSGQRIDNFLNARLRDVPRTHIYRMLRRGEVRVNRRRARQGYRLQTGDVVRIPPLERRGDAAGPSRPPPALLERLEAALLHEDAALLVLNKPAGLPVHGGTGLGCGIIEALRVLRPRAPGLELVHRLDRETSGCLLVAKRRAALKALHRSLRERRVEKRYRLLVRGRWRGGERRVNAPLRKNVLRGGERLVTAQAQGKAAETVFRPIRTSPAASFLEAHALTGRTHQIRVHAAGAGHPIAGDAKYGDREFNRTLRGAGLRRMFLHAARIDFPHPDSDTPVRVTAPLDAELDAVLRRLALAGPMASGGSD